VVANNYLENDRNNIEFGNVLAEGREASDILAVPVAAGPKTWVCSRLLAGIAGSNPAGGTYVCVF
jgi:hypothetical protein